ncbi:MAG: histidine kinase dimerization/phospho-acceptor domain-containing protein, partial [Chloroflexota bacterium]
MKNKKEHHLLKSREAIVVMHNVNERARLEQMKSDFINCATHNLRTPLTTIILMLRLLEGECTPEE